MEKLKEKLQTMVGEKESLEERIKEEKDREIKVELEEKLERLEGNMKILRDYIEIRQGDMKP